MLPEFVGLKRRSQVILVDIIAVRFAQTIAPVQTAMLAPPSATPDLEVSQKRTYRDVFDETIRTHVGDQYEQIKSLVDTILSPFVRECCVVVETTHQKNVLKVVKKRGDYDAAQDLLLHMDIDWSDQSTWTVLKMMYDERERQTFNGRTFHEILGASSMGEGWTRFQILIQAVYGNTHAFFAQTRREHYGDQVSARIRAIRMRSQYEKEILQLSTEVTQLEARRGAPGAGMRQKLARALNAQEFALDRQLKAKRDELRKLQSALDELPAFERQLEAASLDLAAQPGGAAETYSRRLARLIVDDKFGEGGRRTFGIIDAIGEIAYRQEDIDQSKLERNLAEKTLGDFKWEIDMNDLYLKYWKKVVSFVENDYATDEKIEEAVKGTLLPPLKEVVDTWRGKDPEVAPRVLFYLLLFTERAIAQYGRASGLLSGVTDPQAAIGLIGRSFMETRIPSQRTRRRFAANSRQMALIIHILNNGQESHSVLRDEMYAPAQGGAEELSTEAGGTPIGVRFSQQRIRELVRSGHTIRLIMDRWNMRSMKKALNIGEAQVTAGGAVTGATEVGASAFGVLGQAWDDAQKLKW